MQTDRKGAGGRAQPKDERERRRGEEKEGKKSEHRERPIYRREGNGYSNKREANNKRRRRAKGDGEGVRMERGRK